MRHHVLDIPCPVVSTYDSPTSQSSTLVLWHKQTFICPRIAEERVGLAPTGNFRTLSRIARNSGRIRKKVGHYPFNQQDQSHSGMGKNAGVIASHEKGKNGRHEKHFANRLSYRSQISPRTTDVTTIQRWNHMERGKEYRFKTI